MVDERRGEEDGRNSGERGVGSAAASYNVASMPGLDDGSRMTWMRTTMRHGARCVWKPANAPRSKLTYLCGLCP